MEIMELTLQRLTDYSILFLEYICVLMVIFAGIQGVVNLFRRSSDTRIALEKGLSLGLLFKLGSEILRCITDRSYAQIGLTACLLALNIVFAAAICWEMKNSESQISEAEQSEASESGEQ